MLEHHLARAALVVGHAEEAVLCAFGGCGDRAVLVAGVLLEAERGCRVAERIAQAPRRLLQQLRAKIKRLETEAEILKKATALLMSDPDRFS